MKRLIAVAATLCCLSSAGVAQESSADASGPADATVLFNGQDLSGWAGRDGLWSVEEGAIVGRTTKENPIEGNTFLVWQEGRPSDFELVAEFKIEGGNSGIQYRSTVMDKEKYVVGGYQADIDSTNKFAGIIYEEKGRGILTGRGVKTTIGPDGEMKTERFAKSEALAKGIHPGKWNSYRIVADGNHLTQYINGAKVSEMIDKQSEKAAESGVIALQLHRGPAMTVRFKNLVLRER